ncbi:MAG: response regulator [Cyclobacteriaceae bacterium]
MAESKKVLIAEDSSVISNLTKKILLIQNYDIDGAKNGKQVLDKLNKTKYDVILMDINMPVMDGMECAREIRSMDDSEKSNVPLIAISGNARNYSMEDFKEAGFNEYLQKPLNFDELVEMVKKYTNN